MSVASAPAETLAFDNLLSRVALSGKSPQGIIASLRIFGRILIWLWVKNTGYPKKPGLVKGKIDQNHPKAVVPKGWHLFDP